MYRDDFRLINENNDSILVFIPNQDFIVVNYDGTGKWYRSIEDFAISGQQGKFTEVSENYKPSEKAQKLYHRTNFYKFA